MNDVFTLYRGDAQKITEFDIKKTHRSSLFGRGVYLTDSFNVANTYRTKGYRGGGKIIEPLIWQGKANSRPDALEKAFDSYLSKVYQVEHSVPYSELRGERKNRHIVRARELYKQAFADGLIKVDYLGGFFGQRPENLKVTYERPLTVGYVTEFKFPRQTFLSSVVKIDTPSVDPLFWEIVWEKKIQIGDWAFLDKDTFIKVNTSQGYYWSRNDPTSRNLYTPPKYERCDALRHALEPFGYRGFEYSGGRYIGGHGTHRAFVIWDDDFVNAHKTRRISSNQP